MSDLHHWIKQVRVHMGLSQEKFGEIFAKTKGNVSAWENGRHSPSIDQVMRMSELSGLPIPGSVRANVGPAPERTGRVPLISWVQAGDWAHAADLLQPGEGFEWIDTSVTVRPHTFALRVEGDSMEPEFVAGTVLVVEPEIEAYPGDFVIAKNGDEATFKQLVRDGADLYLKPLNPRYPIKPLGTARIIGVVREAVKRYR